MGMSAFGEPRYNYEYLLYENNHRGIKSLEVNLLTLHFYTKTL